MREGMWRKNVHAAAAGGDEDEFGAAADDAHLEGRGGQADGKVDAGSIGAIRER